MAVEDILETTVAYKKILAAHMFEVQSKVFGFLRALEKGWDEALVSGVERFFEQDLCLTFPDAYKSWSNQDRTGI